MSELKNSIENFKGTLYHVPWGYVEERTSDLEDRTFEIRRAK